MFSATVIIGAMLLAGCRQPLWRAEDRMLLDNAKILARQTLIMDTHIDVPYRLNDKMDDVARGTSGDFDYPRAVKGGLDAFFIVAYVPPEMEQDGTARAFTEKTLDDIQQVVRRHPDKFALARSPEEVRAQFGDGRVSFILAIENGAPVEGDLTNVEHFFRRGVRYITLAHGKCNHICDSSYDNERKWHGLSPFGRELVAEMNRLGMMIDVSHLSDESFYDVLKHSRTPVIASHSSCRHFTPGMERNMDDAMIKAMAEKGGIIHINFGAMFLNPEVARKSKERWDAIDAYLAEHKLEGEARQKWVAEYKKAHPVGSATVADVANHIDHVVALVGIDHVGLGSDFDGVGDQVPVGLEDVSCYPNLIYELLRRGYSEADIRKICGENFLRVWSQILLAAQTAR
ncbi:MAG: dipeptidase [Phycisphaerae bacterium]|nr:dipeptidase [Phycisphaerae bacterium]